MIDLINASYHFKPYVYVFEFDNKITKFGISCSIKNRMADYNKQFDTVDIIHVEPCKSKTDVYNIEDRVKKRLARFIEKGTNEFTGLYPSIVTAVVKYETKQYYKELNKR